MTDLVEKVNEKTKNMETDWNEGLFQMMIICE